MVKFITKTVCMAFIAALCVSSVFAQTRTPNVKAPVVTPSALSLQDACPDQSRDVWDVLWAFNVDQVQGTQANFSPFLWGDKLYITKWSELNGVAYRFARSGSTWVTDGSVTITGLTYNGVNAEGFCTDGEFLYCCTGGANIYKINPAVSWAATIQCSVPGQYIDALAYDEDTDCFWIAEYNKTPVRRVNKSGAVQQTLTAGMVVSDLTWEKTSDGTPYLWTLCNTTGQKNLHRFNLTTNQFQANAQSTAGVPNVGNAGGGAGLFTGYDAVLEKMVLIGLLEGTNDVAFCFELGGGEGPDDPCPAVTNVTAEAQGNKVKVSWTAATGDVANYKIYQDGVEKATVAAGTTTWTSDALANGSYTFAVAATYADGCIPVKVAAAPVTVQSCSAVVSNVQVAYATDCSKATITWDAAGKSRAFADAYVLNTFSTGDYSSIILETGAKTLVGPKPTFLTDETPTGDDFDGTTMYRITNFGRVFSVAENGTQTLIGTIAGITNCVGLAYDWKNEEGFYFVDIASSNTSFSLYKLSIPSLDKTLIGTAGGTFRRGLALHEDGYLYSLTTSTVTATPSNLIRVDPANGQITTVGPIDFPAMYGFGLAYDRVADVLYASPIHFDPAPVAPDHRSKLISLNTTTGAATLIKDYGLLQHATLSCTKGGSEPQDPEYNVYRNDVKIAGPIKETTFDDTTFDKTQPYTWSVAVVCPSGGEGERIGKAEDACDKTPPPPCNKVTGEAAVIDCETATITWTAVAGAKGYKVNGGAMITATEYTETGEFEDGETYKWNIVTVCEENESDAVEVSGVAECVGINELALNVAIFPNPANSTVTIKVANFAKVEVYNTVGQLVETKTVSSFDVSTYNTGIYFFKVYDVNNNSVTKRVMVTK